MIKILRIQNAYMNQSEFENFKSIGLNVKDILLMNKGDKSDITPKYSTEQLKNDIKDSKNIQTSISHSNFVKHDKEFKKLLLKFNSNDCMQKFNLNNSTSLNLLMPKDLQKFCSSFHKLIESHEILTKKDKINGQKIQNLKRQIISVAEKQKFLFETANEKIIYYSNELSTILKSVLNKFDAELSEIDNKIANSLESLTLVDKFYKNAQRISREKDHKLKNLAIECKFLLKEMRSEQQGLTKLKNAFDVI